MRGWKNIFHENGNQKRTGVAIVISIKTNIKIKNVTRDKEEHYIMIKGSIQEDITIINIYAHKIGAPQYIRQMLTVIKEEIDSNKIIVGGFNTSLTPKDRSSKMKMNKETEALNDTIGPPNSPKPWGPKDEQDTVSCLQIRQSLKLSEQMRDVCTCMQVRGL